MRILGIRTVIAVWFCRYNTESYVQIQRIFLWSTPRRKSGERGLEQKGAARERQIKNEVRRVGGTEEVRSGQARKRGDSGGGKVHTVLAAFYSSFPARKRTIRLNLVARFPSSPPPTRKAAHLQGSRRSLSTQPQCGYSMSFLLCLCLVSAHSHCCVHGAAEFVRWSVFIYGADPLYLQHRGKNWGEVRRAVKLLCSPSE